MIQVYVDASSYSNPGPGGVGIVLNHNGSIEERKSIPVTEETTNAKLELIAVIEGLKLLKKKKYAEKKITLFSDSQYAIGIAHEKLIPRKNLEICSSLIKAFVEFPNLSIEYIESRKNPADSYAKIASKEAAKKLGLLKNFQF